MPRTRCSRVRRWGGGGEIKSSITVEIEGFANHESFAIRRRSAAVRPVVGVDFIGEPDVLFLLRRYDYYSRSTSVVERFFVYSQNSHTPLSARADNNGLFSIRLRIKYFTLPETRRINARVSSVVSTRRITGITLRCNLVNGRLKKKKKKSNIHFG